MRVGDEGGQPGVVEVVVRLPQARLFLLRACLLEAFQRLLQVLEGGGAVGLQLAAWAPSGRVVLAEDFLGEGLACLRSTAAALRTASAEGCLSSPSSASGSAGSVSGFRW